MVLAFVAILKDFNPFDELNHGIGHKILGFFPHIQKAFQTSPKYTLAVSNNNKERFYLAMTNISDPKKTLSFSSFLQRYCFCRYSFLTSIFHSLLQNLIPPRQVA